MKKILLGILAVVIVVLVLCYFLAFSPFGNGLGAQIAQKRINKKYKNLDFKINKFVLRPNKLRLDASFKGAKLSIGGNISIFTLGLDLVYDENITDLQPLAKSLKQNFSGALLSKGTIKGKHEKYLIKGIEKLAGGEGNYTIGLNGSHLTSLKLDAKNLQVKALEAMLGKSSYVAGGTLELKANIKNANIHKLDGNVTTKLSGVKLSKNKLNDDFSLGIKKDISLDSTSSSILKNTNIASSMELDSNLGNIKIKKSTYDLEDKALNASYQVFVPNLAVLNNISGAKLQGEVNILGKIKKSKNLIIDGHSFLLGGELSFVLKNNNLNANLNHVRLKSFLKMLSYPQIFDSYTSAKISYNLKKKIGDLKGEMSDGHFMKNQLSEMLIKFTSFDLNSEIYKKIFFDSKIDQDILNSKLDMQSKNTRIKVLSSTINLKKLKIDSILRIKIKKAVFDSRISGDLKHPDMKVDLSKLVEAQFKKRIGSKIGRRLNLSKIFK